MYASLRTYRVRSDQLDGLMHRVDRDFAQAIAQEPGFVAYQAIETGPETIMTISTFRDRAQAEASEALAAQWVAEELQDFELSRIGVLNGEVMVSRADKEMLEPSHH